eukprot:9928998-Prorocentrum_lima.AAC.1
MLEDSTCLQQLKVAFSEARSALLGPAHVQTPLVGPDRALRRTSAAIAQAALLHSTRELLVAHWEFLSLQGQEPTYSAT